MAEEKKGFSEQEKIELKEAFSEIENNLGTKMATQTKEAVDKALKENEDLDGLKKWRIETEAASEKNQKALDKLIAQGDTIKIGAKDIWTFQKEFAKQLEAKKDKLAAYKKDRAAVSFEMELKTVGDIAAANFTISGTEQFVDSQQFHPVGRKPYELTHVRDLPGIRVGPIGPAQDVYVIRDSGGEGGPTSVAVGVAKPQSDRDWVKTKVPITKIAHYYKIPEEYLDDIVWLRDEITAVGVEELLDKEDSMFLTNSAGGEFLGLNQTFNSTVALPPVGLLNGLSGPAANNYDVLVSGWTQLRVLKNRLTAVLMNPVDYALMILEKDTTGNYLFGAPNQAIPNLFGAPIIAHNAMTSDKYLMGDFSKIKIGQRMGISVRFYDQNEDDAITNMVTVVIEERATIAADRADRLLYGDFSTQRGQLDVDVAS